MAMLRYFVPDYCRMTENISQSTYQYVQLEQMITELRNMISQQGQMIAPFQKNQTSSRDDVSQATKESAIQKLSRFRKFAPLPFKEAKDSDEADEWLDELEGVLEILKTEEEDKMMFTEFLLQGEVRLWWNMEKKKQEGKEYSWKDFQKNFLR